MGRVGVTGRDRVLHLADLGGRRLAARVASNAHADDVNIELIVGSFHDAPNRALRNDAFGHDTIDAGRHFGPVGQKGTSSTWCGCRSESGTSSTINVKPTARG